MRITSAPRGRGQAPWRASELVTRLAIILGVASALTLAAMALVGLDSSWTLVAVGEAAISLALLSQT
jgi:hypothetical protein